MELSKVTLEIFSKLEQKWLYHCEPKKTRVLSIDGGGASAIVAGAALVHLEEQIRSKTGDCNAAIVDFFDLIAGTGIGALLASMITADNGHGRPLFSAKEAVEFLAREGTEMFKTRKMRFFSGRNSSQRKIIEKVLKDVFKREDGKELTLQDTCKPLIVPCFDLNSAAPFVFSRADAAESASFDFELWKVCIATSANPATSMPFKFDSIDKKTACLAVDGGLVMNNPTSAAITHVLHNKRDFPLVNGVEDLLVLSIGSGSTRKGNLKLRRDGGCAAEAIVGIAVDGVSETIDQLLGNAFCLNRNDYVRIQANGLGCDGGQESGVLEERGVETMPFGGKRLLTETNGERIASFVQRLVASGRSSLPPSPCKDIAVSPLANGR